LIRRTAYTFSLALIFGGGLLLEAQEFVPGRLLVGHLDGASEATLTRNLGQRRGARVQKIGRLPISRVEVTDDQLEAVEVELRESGLYSFVERDYYAHGSAQPNDPSFPSQWHLSKIAGPAAWDINHGSSGVIIAIVDSGVDGTHPDLASKMVPGWNFLNGNSDTHDVLGHGTAVAGTAAAATDNGTGVAGVNWMSRIMPLVVLDSSDYATYSNIANAIMYAADNGAKIINVSIAGTTSSSTLQNAVNYAWGKGAVVIAAAGNFANSAPAYPAACNYVIAVGASTDTDTLAYFSSYGSWVDLVAPGTYITTTNNGGGYGTWQGTSFASPIVAGVAALALSVNGSLSPTALTNLLLNTADDLGAVGFDSTFGWGRVNAYRAVTMAGQAPMDTAAPVLSIASPSTGASVSATVSVTGTSSDNMGVTRVEFYVDGVLNSTTASSSFSFPWLTTSVVNGSHILMVKAFDAANNSATMTRGVTVSNFASIADTQAPAVWITSVTPSGANLKLSASASDNVGVRQINLYVDGTLVDYGSTSPFSTTWNMKKLTSGTHTVTATATDAAGNVGRSAAVSFVK